MPKMENADERRSGPFEGLTVLEIGQYIVVPFCAQLLADGGARVIKIEPAAGDAYRSMDPIEPMESRQFIMKNRGKESVGLRLGAPQTSEILRRLIEVADVVLVNMRASTVEKHGLSYEKVYATNPRVVYGGVTAFGRSGPEAGLAGMDVVVQARSGLLYAFGAEEDGVPYHSEVQVADYASSLLLLSGITTALYTREVTGEGQEVDVSLFGGALTMQNNVLSHFHDHDQWRSQFTGEVLPRARREGWSSSQIDAARTEMRPDTRLTVCYRVFRTADGAVAVGAGSPTVQRRLWALLGIDSEGTDLASRLEAAMAAERTEHWLKTLQAHSIPVADLKHVDEMFDDSQARAQDLVRTFEHPVAGAYDALGVPIKLSKTPFDPRRTSPSFAVDTQRVLGELGYDDHQIAGFAAQGSIVMPELP